MRRIEWMYIIAFLLLSTQLSAQTIAVDVSSKQVNVGESFLVEYSVEGSVEDFQLPDFKGFKVYQTGQSTNVSIVNGKISKSISYNITLVPDVEGEYEIGSAKGNYKGKVIYSPTFKMKVVNQGNTQASNSGGTSSNSPQQVDAASDNWRDNIFLIAEASKSQLYVGEQLTITYKLLRRIDYQSLEVEKLPVFNHFLSEEMEIPDHQTEGLMEYKGKKYYYQAFRKVALFATQPGEQTIDPLLVRGVILVPERDPFFGTTFFSSSQPKMVNFSSNKLKINVLPLPIEQQPKNFSGAVGQFDVKRSVNNTTIAKGQSVNMNVEVKGWGNLKAIANIPMETSSSLEFYPPEIVDSPQKSGDTYGGERRFSYAIVPQKEGSIVIPQSEFVYFDPNQKKYISQPLESISLNILPEEMSNVNEQELKDTFYSSLKNNSTKSDASLLILFIAASAGVPILGFIGIVAWKKNVRNRNEDIKKSVFKWPEIDNLPEQKKFVTLAEAFRLRLREVLNISSTLDNDVLAEIKEDVLREKVKYILLAFDSAAYSPIRISSIQELQSLANDCLNKISDQQITKP
ncbi:MAG: BatD family protein [Chitinophagales bacterium]|nr:BatD family protein [Chitinophagales bacterium]